MSAKHLLSESYQIEMQIKAKEEQIAALRDRAEKVTSTISDMPRGGNGKTMSDIVDNIADLEAEIAADTDRLINKQREIKRIIDSVENDKYRTLLELRYINHHEWQDIADEMHFDYRWVTRMHGKVLKMIDEKTSP